MITSPTYYETIPGWFWPEAQQLYQAQFANASPESVFVEIGCYLGRSACYLGELIVTSGKWIEFYTVDHFRGCAELPPQAFKDTHARCDAYLRLAGVRPYVQILQMDSVAAADKFNDQSVDFIYVDGGHQYAQVMADLQAWRPKLKPGGVIGGDDYAPEFAGVQQAVNEVFGTGVGIRGRVWAHTMGDPGKSAWEIKQ